MKAIYPPSLKTERCGNDNKNVNYLHLNIDIKLLNLKVFGQIQIQTYMKSLLICACFLFYS